ncbi:MAG: hypothetical protein ACI936_000896 [Paraglaciecola sp.]|jgi:hypothetical protein
MLYHVLLRVFIICLTLVALNVSAQSILWGVNDSPILINTDVVIPAGDVLSIDAGAEIRFGKDVEVIINGKIDVVGQGKATLTNTSGDKWKGLNINSDEAFSISNLNISQADIGIKLTSSANVTISDNLLENNTTAISLHVDNGFRGYINTIRDNEIRDNVTGIVASSTGADIQSNLLVNNTDYGIELTGRTCAGGTACGWQSIVQNNLISGSEVGVDVFSHNLTMNNNDIFNTIVGIANRNLVGTSYNVTDNNVLGWSAFAFANRGFTRVDAGNIWFGQPESEQTICDAQDNINLGSVTFTASNVAFSTTHNYTLPTALASETRAAHSTCPQVERVEDDFTAVSFSAGVKDEDTPYLDFNIAVSKKFSDARFIRVLFWSINAQQTWTAITRGGADDVFSTRLFLSKFIKSGGYEIRSIIAVDNSGSEIRIDDSYLNQGGYDYRTVMVNANADDAAPTLQEMTYSTPYSDSIGQLHIDFSLSASDNVSGLNSEFVIELLSPTGTSIKKRGLFAQEGLTQASATLDFILPPYSASGVYYIRSIRLVDLAGNITDSQSWVVANDTDITIVDPSSDNVPPTLDNVTLAADFDLLVKRPIINVSVIASDDASGVKSSYVRLRKPDGGLLVNWMLKNSLSSRTATASTEFTTVFALTSDYVTGDYTVVDFCITDEANNESCYSANRLVDLELQERLNVNFFDADADSIPDLYDVFPSIPIGDLPDTDGDGAPDDCGADCVRLTMSADDDDDGDSFSDIEEIAAGSNPLDSTSTPVIDTDLDGIDDSVDNCPLIANFAQLNTDDDILGNACDADDDNDRMPDVYEIANSLNSLDSSDARLDPDNDSLDNLKEYQLGTDINDADTDDDGIADNVDADPLVFDKTDPRIYSGQLYVLPDITADGVKDLGILSVNTELSQIQLDVLNGASQTLINTIVWSDNYSDSTISLHILDDMNGNGVSEVGLFGLQDTQANAGKSQVFIRDLSTSNRVSVLNWPANWSSVSALVLPDITGDGVQEIAIQGRFKEFSRPQLVVKNGLTNKPVDTFSYPNLFIGPIYNVHSDIDGDGVEEVSTFGRIERNGKIQVKLANGLDSKDRLKAYNFPDKWSDISWHRLDDMNGDGEDDWGLLGRNREDGRVQLIVKDGVSSKGALAIYAWPPQIQSPTFHRIPDMNNDGVEEVAIAGQRSNNARYQFQIKDGQDRNVLLANHNLNLTLTDVSYHVLPDLSGDGLVEIGFLGLNPEGEYELVIRHGDISQGEFRVDNLGSDWSAPPLVISLGDTDNDGVDNLLIYGQNLSEQLIMQAY